MQSARVYSFPESARLRSPSATAPSDNPPAVSAAVEKGYAEGLAQGRAAAAAASATAHQEALEAGRAQGLQELRGAAAALAHAIKLLDAAREELVHEAEGFCVELVMAAVAKLAQLDQTRTAFLQSAIADALRTIGPAPQISIRLNPADAKLIKKIGPKIPIHADEQIALGAALIDGGRLLAEVSLDHAIAELRAATTATRSRRARKKPRA